MSDISEIRARWTPGGEHLARVQRKRAERAPGDVAGLLAEIDRLQKIIDSVARKMAIKTSTCLSFEPDVCCGCADRLDTARRALTGVTTTKETAQ